MKPDNFPFNFKYFIDFALNDKISWEILEIVLDDHSKTLAKSRELNKILLQQLKIFKESEQNQLEKDSKELIDESDYKEPKTSVIPIDFDPLEDETYQNEVEYDFPTNETEQTDLDIEILVTEKESIDPDMKSIKLEPMADGKKLFKCKMCSRKFEAKQMKDHRQSSHKHQKLFIECSLCGKIFKDEPKNIEYKKLFSHERKHRKQDNAEALKTCKECHKRFSTPWKVKKHMIIHDKLRQKPFQCKTCLVKFFSLDGLNSHIVKQHFQHIEALM